MSETAYLSDMSIDERVMMAIVRVAERFKKNSSALVNNWGLTFPQYNLLRVLDASANGQNTMKNVNRIMLVSSANMTGIAKRLEKTGFITRTSDPNDDRSKRLQITPQGIEVLKAISDHKERNVKRYLIKYTDEQKTELLETLRGILKQTKGLKPSV
ncbi:MAG: MarR family transcriptional regulator [Desulfomonile tiedjei]|uniref:MarR family transcriptional regulator n=1 Tax=Desulfomonile tiedjei TaxID=2358 RepID=A0A9D6V1L5_9BACT|nr:MarR family transcriptional regulator [Desulfomonile tiedjei]